MAKDIVRQYETLTFSFQGPPPRHSQVFVNLTGHFCCQEEHWDVSGYYAGDGEYQLRFLPLKTGEYQYHVTGCIEHSGSFTVLPALPGVHGPVRAHETRFTYQDGNAFHPFGTTVYALFHQPDELVEETLDTLKHSPFNKLRTCLFPKYYDFNHDDPPLYPFERDKEGEWDVHRPCFPFWNRVEKMILRLQSMGVETDLILFHSYDKWGFSTMSLEQDCVYLEYLLRRFSAFPGIWWSLGNEYDLCRKTIGHWETLEEYVSAHDPCAHLLSCHNALRLWDFSRPNVSHVSIQSKALWRVNAWRERYGKPVIIDECGYEGNFPHTWGCLSAKELTARFWRCCTTGAYASHGETYYDGKSEIIWWSRGGKLKGESAARIAFLRSVIESLPGHLEGIDTPPEQLAKIPVEEREKVYEQLGDLQTLARALWPLSAEETSFYIDSEITYQGRVGEKAYLNYYDLRCSAWDTLHLPRDQRYRVELIDTWAMTRKPVFESVSGDVDVPLPGREYMAVLAVALD